MRGALVAVGIVAGCGRLGFDAGSTPDARAVTTYRDAVLDDHPTAYWRLGTPAPGRDEMGQFDATFKGTCAAVQGPLNADADTALHFNGSSCFAVIPSGLEFPNRAPFTVEAWIRDERVDSYQIYFIKETRMGNGPLDGYALLINSNGVYLERIVNTGGQVTNPTPIAANQWIHVVGTYDGAVVRLYFDGVQVGPAKTAPDTMPAVPMESSIGAYPAGNTFLQGDMDELAIYDYALSPQQIVKHHDIGINGPLVAN
ncbi:MAG TPA: LamG domain-containing protein [Kofleriaceae bacterium]|nr:LamG domain-containing protein [Kofleriaceae bacterium]